MQEHAVQPLVPEYRTVLQLVAGEDEEAGHRAVEQQREREQGPQPLREQHRQERDRVFILYVMRSERLLRTHLLEQRREQANTPEHE